MICLIIVPAFMHTTDYNFLYGIINYILMIVTYKYILNLSFTKAIISCGILLFSLFLLDFISNLFLAIFLSVDQMRNTWYINLSINIIFSIILLIVYNNKKIYRYFENLIDKISKRRQTNVIIFLLLTIVAMSTLLYLLGNNYNLNAVFTTNFLIF